MIIDYNSLNKTGIHDVHNDTDGKWINKPMEKKEKFCLMVKCQLINTEGLMELENHQLTLNHCCEALVKEWDMYRVSKYLCTNYLLILKGKWWRYRGEAW